jgi:pimeloyl-ACP methyl ester carboxylesterase
MPELAGVSHSFHEVRGVRLHVAEAGEGEPLVLLHGWPENWWCWHKVIPALVESGYRVLAPDMRGYGWSDPAPDGYDKENLAADLVALLDVLGLERVQLIGHDWGSWVGFLVSLDHPDRIERFIATGISHPFREVTLGDALGLWRLGYQLPLAAPLVGRALANTSWFVPRMIRAGAARTDAFSERDLEIYAATCRPETTVATYRTSLLKDIPATIRGRYRRRLTVPTRLMNGGQEIVISPDSLGGYEKYADDMDVEILEGVGHFVPEEAPGDVIRLARSFLRPAREHAAPAT